MRTKEDEKRIKRDLAASAKFMDSPEGKKVEKMMDEVLSVRLHEKPLITITDGYIQDDAEAILERKLTGDELEEVVEKINEGLTPLVQDSINDVVDFNKLIKENNGAEKIRPNFQVHWKNYCAYHSEFSLAGTFRTEKEARKYIDYRGTTFGDVWKIVLVDPAGFETEIKIEEDF